MVPPTRRGALTLTDRVVAKVAAQAAHEALRAAGAGRRSPPGGAARPRATATVRRADGQDGEGGRADVRIALELAFPSDIGAQCGAVRRTVIRRVGELAGLDVPHVAVDVERLHAEHRRGGHPGRVR